MESKDNLLGVVQTIWNWRKPILWVCGIAIVGTALISLLMPNYYKSTTIFLATSPDQAKPENLFGNGANRVEYYGNANDIDRLLTIAESNELLEYLVDSFHLYDHYKINPKSERAPFFVKEKFFSLYEVKKNKRDAIEMSVEDRDKALAAKIANAAREKLDEIAQKLIKEGQRQSIETFRQEIQLKQEQLQILSDTVAALRSRYNVYNPVAQTESLTEQQSLTKSRLILNQTRLTVLRATPGVPRDTIIMLNALVKGLEEEVKDFETRMQMLNSGMGIVMTYEKQYYESNERLSQDLARLKIFLAAYEANIPATVLVERAEVPIVKSRPKRSVWVIAAGAIAFIFSVVAILMIDTYQATWSDAWQTPTVADNNVPVEKKRKKKKKKAKSQEQDGAME